MLFTGVKNMCGIVGAVAQRNVVPILLEGLLRLEYRGYDSAGLALVHNGQLERVRSIGRVADLTKKSAHSDARIGIAHTRWATHGVPASATPTRTSAKIISRWCITALSKTTSPYAPA